MISGELVTLRAIEPADFEAFNSWANDVEVELLGGGDPPMPHTLAATSAMIEERTKDPHGVNFVIVADETVIGQCGLFSCLAGRQHRET